MKNKNRAEPWLTLYCLLAAALLIGLCSRSSPLYPINDWNDTNCFFTVGKAMFNGRVVYRDIYEQKGVLLYFLYGLAWLVSHRSFFGAYLLETLCFAVFLRTAAETARRLGVLRGFALLLPCLAAVLCSSFGFFLGGSAEEIALPFLYPALHVFLTSGEDGVPTPRRALLLGFLAGCVLWIKYTLLGLYFGYALYLLVLLTWRRDFKTLGQMVGCFFAGIALATLPWVLYFAVNGALGDWFEVYFFANMKYYSFDTLEEYSRLSFLTREIGNAILWNGRTSLLIALGAAAFLLSRRRWPRKLGLLLIYACATLLPYIGGSACDYYAFAYAPMAAPGALALAWLLERGIERLPIKGETLKTVGATLGCFCLALLCGFLAWRFSASIFTVYAVLAVLVVAALAFLRGPAWNATLRRVCAALLCLAVLAGSGVFAWRHSINSFFAAYAFEDLWFSRFAADIAASEDQSLLNYGSLDSGLYTVTGYVPQTRFFCTLNLRMPEMWEEIDGYLREGRTKFVVTPVQPPALLLENYEIVDSVSGFSQFEERPCDYYLLQRKEP